MVLKIQAKTDVNSTFTCIPSLFQCTYYLRFLLAINVLFNWKIKPANDWPSPVPYVSFPCSIIIHLQKDILLDEGFESRSLILFIFCIFSAHI